MSKHAVRGTLQSFLRLPRCPKIKAQIDNHFYCSYYSYEIVSPVEIMMSDKNSKDGNDILILVWDKDEASRSSN